MAAMGKETKTPPVYLQKQLNINELNEGTIMEVDVEETLSSSSEDEFDDELSNTFKENFNKLKLSEDEEIDLSTLTVDKLKERMTPITDDGLVLKVTTIGGSGIVMPEKSIVVMNYEAYVENETKPFDSTYLRGQPHRFVLNAGQVIIGLDKAVTTMRKGEHAKFWIDCAYAYGPQGCPPRIPANANILYDVEIINFFDSKDAIEFEEMLPDDQRTAPFEKVYATCKVEHEVGNNLFKMKKLSAAGGRYARAVKLLEQVNAKDEKEDEKRDKLLLNLYSNLSLINFCMKKASRAIYNGKKAEHLAEYLGEKQVTVYYRLGQAFTLNSEFDKAKSYLLKANQMKPYDADITNALANLDSKAKRFMDYEKNFCRNMFNSNVSKSEVTSQESDKFKEIVNDAIVSFVNSNDTDYEFPSTFSESQIEVIKALAHTHNLKFFEKVYNGQKIIKIKKAEAEE